MLFVRQLGSVLLQLGSVLLQLSLRSSVSAAQSPQLSLLSSVSSAQSPQLSLLSSVMMTRTQHGAAARLLDQSELDDGGSVAILQRRTPTRAWSWQQALSIQVPEAKTSTHLEAAFDSQHGAAAGLLY